jgi:hypothetical protein
MRDDLHVFRVSKLNGANIDATHPWVAPGPTIRDRFEVALSNSYPT